MDAGTVNEVRSSRTDSTVGSAASSAVSSSVSSSARSASTVRITWSSVRCVGTGDGVKPRAIAISTTSRSSSPLIPGTPRLTAVTRPATRESARPPAITGRSTPSPARRARAAAGRVAGRSPRAVALAVVTCRRRSSTSGRDRSGAATARSSRTSTWSSGPWSGAEGDEGGVMSIPRKRHNMRGRDAPVGIPWDSREDGVRGPAAR